MINRMQDRMATTIAFVWRVRIAQDNLACTERLSDFIDFHTRLAQVMRVFAERKSPNSDRKRP